MRSFRIDIHPPKSKRLTDKKVRLSFSQGFYGETTEEVFSLKPEDSFFVFKVPNNFDWIHNTSVLDGSCFDVEIEYTNPTNTRTETVKPVPYEV